MTKEGKISSELEQIKIKREIYQLEVSKLDAQEKIIELKQLLAKNKGVEDD